MTKKETLRKEAPAGCAVRIGGERARSFLHQACTADVLALEPGQGTGAMLLDPDGKTVDQITIRREASNDTFLVICSSEKAISWLKALSDGYVPVEKGDRFCKVNGPAAIHVLDEVELRKAREAKSPAPQTVLSKPFFVGRSGKASPERPLFSWKTPKIPLRKTPMFEWHKSKGARLLEFGTYSMPGWYGRVLREHRAVREAAGLFDVGHMGPLEIAGPNAAEFLDAVSTNFVYRLEVGQSQYTYLLDVNASVMDDVIIYRLEKERFMMVVNAGNQDKIWDWLTGVNEGRYAIDKDDRGKSPAKTSLLRLKDRAAGERACIDLALQGPASAKILEELGAQGAPKLAKFTHIHQTIKSIPVLVSRTGYTGAEIGYEVFVHPLQALKLWELLIAGGAQPCGLAARDSTRTEAGFPLYGHELAGKFDLTPTEAGYGGFVKRHKPFFVGRKPLLERESKQTMAIVRFRVKQQGGKPVRADDIVANAQGRVIGWVTTCVVIDKNQIGLAYVLKDTIGEFGIHRSRHAEQRKLGEKLEAHVTAEVLPRFQTFGG